MKQKSLATLQTDELLILSKYCCAHSKKPDESQPSVSATLSFAE